ncbi:NAD-dependent malic enzyme, partial [Candidatus Uhrbacteria bacterium]|nr:NAD-dependent malic enzyme [Candidatus Uhrbacteria bacterium]
ADALARLVQRPTPDRIIPSIFDRRIVPTVARAVARAWKEKA